MSLKFTFEQKVSFTSGWRTLQQLLISTLYFGNSQLRKISYYHHASSVIIIFFKYHSIAEIP